MAVAMRQRALAVWIYSPKAAAFEELSAGAMGKSTYLKAAIAMYIQGSPRKIAANMRVAEGPASRKPVRDDYGENRMR